MMKRMINSAMMALGIGVEESWNKSFLHGDLSAKGGSGLSLFQCFKVKSTSNHLAKH
jgi:hypothetical protein